VIFDVEIAFIYPVAAVFKQWVNNGRGIFALAEISLFLAILFVGVAYVWVKGDLEWLKRVRVSGTQPERDRLNEAA
jgi:NADH-quinone oxidoreductase subunit A